MYSVCKLLTPIVAVLLLMKNIVRSWQDLAPLGPYRGYKIFMEGAQGERHISSFFTEPVGEF